MADGKDIDGSSSTGHKPFVEPLFPPAQISIEDVRAVFIDAFLMTHYLHTNHPSVLPDTLSPRNIRFHRAASQEAVCVIVDLDSHAHPSNPDARPSTHGTLPFNAYDLMPSLETPTKSNSAAPYKRYRHILEALYYIFLWAVSSPVQQWIDRGPDALLRVLKHRIARTTFMWDATAAFAEVQPEFAPLVGAWLRPLWRLVSDAHFACRCLTGEEKMEKLDSMLTLDRVVEILRAGGGFDLRIATLIPVPGEDSDEGL
ncbi:hypothetical protein DFH08DRAFT_133966 [Mycena albidolilacea]|uniref:Fungal-type protein kinase domain-containing protein n=1 Tax=Mycena albidolilacea TaxID=1033008 RepID=A0AAD7ERY5_9AGAR|nr:hypothetical protein DFH08DRAFT_133966 [Mycena albidolilacea]